MIKQRRMKNKARKVKYMVKEQTLQVLIILNLILMKIIKKIKIKIIYTPNKVVS